MDGVDRKDLQTLLSASHVELSSAWLAGPLAVEAHMWLESVELNGKEGRIWQGVLAGCCDTRTIRLESLINTAKFGLGEHDRSVLTMERCCGVLRCDGNTQTFVSLVHSSEIYSSYCCALPIVILTVILIEKSVTFKVVTLTAVTLETITFMAVILARATFEAVKFRPVNIMVVTIMAGSLAAVRLRPVTLHGGSHTTAGPYQRTSHQQRLYGWSHSQCHSLREGTYGKQPKCHPRGHFLREYEVQGDGMAPSPSLRSRRQAGQ